MPNNLTDWLLDHGHWITGMGVLSMVLLAITLVATPWLLARLPSDHFSRQEISTDRPGPGRVVWLVLRNTLGVLFLLLGVIMLVTPGPGLVGLALGLSLCEFPGKQYLLRRFVSQPSVFGSLNWIRRRRGREPFVYPGD